MINDKILLKNFGLNLNIYRSQLKLSQDYIAEKTGFSKSYVSNVELGKHNLSFVSAVQFACVLNKELSDMIKEH